jgi:glutamate racemase
VIALSSAKNSSSPNQPIGVFDSGVGGLTVVKALRQVLPAEEIVYLGDLARLPYGNKSGETVRRYAAEITQFLLRHQVKLIVMACSTATAWSLDALKSQLPVPIIGVIEPGVQATLNSDHGDIAVIATRGTVASGVYQRHFSPLSVQTLACPLFVPLIEEGMAAHLATQLIVRQYLQELSPTVKTLVLGCTHYPLLAPTIANLYPQLQLIDPAITCAHAVKDLLQSGNLAKNSGAGAIRFFVTDAHQHLDRLVHTFLNEPVRAELTTL